MTVVVGAEVLLSITALIRTVIDFLGVLVVRDCNTAWRTPTEGRGGLMNGPWERGGVRTGGGCVAGR